jgi:hypothetical protein
MATVGLLLLACIVLATASALTTALLRPESLLDAAITLGVVAAAGVAATLLITGALDILTRGALLAAGAIWGVIAAALVASGRGRLPGLRWPRLGLRDHPWAAVLVAIAAVALAWQLVVALVLPPFAYDAISYHLTTVASWVTDQSVDPTPLSLCCAYYPANAELIFSWPMLFADGDSLVDTAQFGFVALGALSVAGIARSAGLSPAGTAAAAALFAATPIVLTQAPTDYADVIVAALALAALHSLIRFAVTGAWQRLVVAGLAAGLLLGTKGTGAVWAVVLGLTAVVVAVVLVRRGRLGARPAAGALVGLLVAFLALGSYWYARNWIDQDNPVYPFDVEFAGVHLFDGPIAVDETLTEPPAGGDQPWPSAMVRSWAADVDFWNQGSYDYQQRAGGLGPLWPWLALPLLIPVTIAMVRRRSPALIAIVAVGVVLVVQPYGWWSRFTIPLIGIGALAVVAAVEWAPRTWMRRAVQAAALALSVIGVALASFEVDPASNAKPIKSQDVLGLIGDPSDERTVGHLFFPEYRFLDRVPDDATVVVDLHAEQLRFVYPLFGPDLTRDVIPSGSDPPPDGAWVVTGSGRPLDRELAGDPRFTLDASVRGVRVWRPA